MKRHNLKCQRTWEDTLLEILGVGVKPLPLHSTSEISETKLCEEYEENT
jgi:hypothetical protein